MFEDATAGVEAGQARRTSASSSGVNRLDDAHATALREHGADIVVADLADLL